MANFYAYSSISSAYDKWLNSFSLQTDNKKAPRVSTLKPKTIRNMFFYILKKEPTLESPEALAIESNALMSKWNTWITDLLELIRRNSDLVSKLTLKSFIKRLQAKEMVVGFLEGLREILETKDKFNVAEIQVAFEMWASTQAAKDLDYSFSNFEEILLNESGRVNESIIADSILKSRGVFQTDDPQTYKQERERLISQIKSIKFAYASGEVGDRQAKMLVPIDTIKSLWEGWADNENSRIALDERKARKESVIKIWTDIILKEAPTGRFSVGGYKYSLSKANPIMEIDKNKEQRFESIKTRLFEERRAKLYEHLKNPEELLRQKYVISGTKKLVDEKSIIVRLTEEEFQKNLDDNKYEEELEQRKNAILRQIEILRSDDFIGLARIISAREISEEKERIARKMAERIGEKSGLTRPVTNDFTTLVVINQNGYLVPSNLSEEYDLIRKVFPEAEAIFEAAHKQEEDKDKANKAAVDELVRIIGELPEFEMFEGETKEEFKIRKRISLRRAKKPFFEKLIPAYNKKREDYKKHIQKELEGLIIEEKEGGKLLTPDKMYDQIEFQTSIAYPPLLDPTRDIRKITAIEKKKLEEWRRLESEESKNIVLKTACPVCNAPTYTQQRIYDKKGIKSILLIKTCVVSQCSFNNWDVMDRSLNANDIIISDTEMSEIAEQKKRAKQIYSDRGFDEKVSKEISDVKKEFDSVVPSIEDEIVKFIAQRRGDHPIIKEKRQAEKLLQSMNIYHENVASAKESLDIGKQKLAELEELNKNQTIRSLLIKYIISEEEIKTKKEPTPEVIDERIDIKLQKVRNAVNRDRKNLTNVKNFPLIQLEKAENELDEYRKSMEKGEVTPHLEESGFTIEGIERVTESKEEEVAFLRKLIDAIKNPQILKEIKEKSFTEKDLEEINRSAQKTFKYRVESVAKEMNVLDKIEAGETPYEVYRKAAIEIVGMAPPVIKRYDSILNNRILAIQNNAYNAAMEEAKVTTPKIRIGKEYDDAIKQLAFDKIKDIVEKQILGKKKKKGLSSDKQKELDEKVETIAKRFVVKSAIKSGKMGDSFKTKEPLSSLQIIREIEQRIDSGTLEPAIYEDALRLVNSNDKEEFGDFPKDYVKVKDSLLKELQEKGFERLDSVERSNLMRNTLSYIRYQEVKKKREKFKESVIEAPTEFSVLVPEYTWAQRELDRIFYMPPDNLKISAFKWMPMFVLGVPRSQLNKISSGDRLNKVKAVKTEIWDKLQRSIESMVENEVAYYVKPTESDNGLLYTTFREVMLEYLQYAVSKKAINKSLASKLANWYKSDRWFGPIEEISEEKEVEKVEKKIKAPELSNEERIQLGLSPIEEPKTVEHFKGKFAFLSNSFPIMVSFEGENYPSVEHAFQAAKTADKSSRKRIQSAKTPEEAIALGNRVVVRMDWSLKQIGIMHDLLMQKFSNPSLRSALLETGNMNLVNLSEDKMWGKDNFGTGQNRLGRILMEIRDNLRPEKPVEIPKPEAIKPEIIEPPEVVEPEAIEPEATQPKEEEKATKLSQIMLKQKIRKLSKIDDINFKRLQRKASLRRFLS